MLENASVQNETGWRMEAFPDVLNEAKNYGVACLGGQFQFRCDDVTCELYWLSADATDRMEDEEWTQFVERTNDEVHRKFDELKLRADFAKEIENWDFLRIKRLEGRDLMRDLWFVAYFVTESEYTNLGNHSATSEIQGGQLRHRNGNQ
jgi:hypothetical protein